MWEKTAGIKRNYSFSHLSDLPTIPITSCFLWISIPHVSNTRKTLSTLLGFINLHNSYVKHSSAFKRQDWYINLTQSDAVEQDDQE